MTFLAIDGIICRQNLTFGAFRLYMFYEFKHLGSPDYLKIEKGDNFSFPVHLHQCFEIIVILSGEMKITVEKDTYMLRKNEGLLIFPNQIHSLESSESEHVLCIFSPKLVQAYATSVAGRVPLDNKFNVPKDYIERMFSLGIDSTTTEKKGVLYSLCAQFDKSREYVKRRKENENLLLKIFSFVEEEFEGDCSLVNLSEKIGYDYSYISRFFKRVVGISFNSYVNYYRLSHACYLMENTNLPILKCSLESGFTSLRSFNRNFKEYFNVTPAEYRKNLKN